MSSILVNLEDGSLCIERVRTLVTESDREQILFDDIEYGRLYTSKVNINNKDFYNKIFLFEEIQSNTKFLKENDDLEDDVTDNLDDLEQDESNDIVSDVLLVFSDNNKIKYIYCNKRNAYKRLVKFRYKVLSIKLNKKKLKIKLVAYILNKYNLNIDNISVFVNDVTSKACNNILVSQRSLSVLEMLKKKTIFDVSFQLDEIVSDGSEVNGNIEGVLFFNGLDVRYRFAKLSKFIKNKRYYYAPLKSCYKDEFAFHIRRTPKGGLIFVKRLKEPIENTFKFKILESKFVSIFMYYVGALLNRVRKKKINLFYEKFASKAEEGVFELFEMCQCSPETKNYFVIDANSADYPIIKHNKNVVKKYSLKYYWLFYNTNYFIASEVPSHLNILRSNNKYLRRATYDKKFVFLQHGIIFMKNLGKNSVFVKGKEGEAQYVVVSSEKERDVVSDMLRYEESQLLNTGLGMYSKIDYGHINADSEDIVTVMLTWKNYEEHLYSFEASSYYQNTIKIFDILQKYVPKEKIMVIPHPKVLDLMQSTSMKDSIWQNKISEALAKTKLLITDYSSVCYNTFYQGGAVIFYQDDLEKYEIENGPLIPRDDEYIGKRCFSMEELENVITESIRNGKIDLSKVRTKEFEESYKTINEFSDGKNIERIYEKLKQLKLV